MGKEYKELDAKVLRDAIKKDYSSLKTSFDAAVTARIKDISQERFG